MYEKHYTESVAAGKYKKSANCQKRYSAIKYKKKQLYNNANDIMQYVFVWSNQQQQQQLWKLRVVDAYRLQFSTHIESYDF